MSARSPLRTLPPQPQRRVPQLVQRMPAPTPLTALRIGFWGFGLLLASVDAWIFRYEASTDSISYLDVSDGVFPGSNWHRLINGVWSPLYPFLLGLFRRIFHVTPANEIVAGHLLNVGFFLFALICFEFHLRAALTKFPLRNNLASGDGRAAVLPTWAYLSFAYALFIWASVFGISLRFLRADMLMSGFVYLAVGMLLRMLYEPPCSKNHVTLAMILGIGFLVKAVFLPIGLVVLAASLFAVEDWRPALKGCAIALAVFLLVGSVYVVPLSLSRGTFTMGESGTFNYLVHVNRVRPTWYFQTLGTARGSFLHPVEKIFPAPPAYAFSWPSLVTHPLRMDLSYWIEGARPRLVLKRQLGSCLSNLRYLIDIQVRQLAPVLIAVLVLALLSWKAGRLSRLKAIWPIWVIGIAGCVLYVPVHVESRYVTEFIALLWIGIVQGLGDFVPVNEKAVKVCAVLMCVPLMLAPMRQIYLKRENVNKPNEDAQAAVELAKLGVIPGDKVARISPMVVDLGIERIARVEITAEVDHSRAGEFWAASLRTQDSLLHLFASRGAKAVIATIQGPDEKNHPGWRHLGSTKYWVWLPKQSD
jgi:hypothetical protein